MRWQTKKENDLIWPEQRKKKKIYILIKDKKHEKINVNETVVLNVITVIRIKEMYLTKRGKTRTETKKKKKNRKNT